MDHKNRVGVVVNAIITDNDVADLQRDHGLLNIISRKPRRSPDSWPCTLCPGRYAAAGGYEHGFKGKRIS
jgi:hypothetical protein